MILKEIETKYLDRPPDRFGINDEGFTGALHVINNPELDSVEILKELIESKPDGIRLVSRFKLTNLPPELYDYEPYDMYRIVNVVPMTLFKSNSVVNYGALKEITYIKKGNYLLVKPNEIYTHLTHNGDLTSLGYLSLLLNVNNRELSYEIKKRGLRLFNRNLNKYFKDEYRK